MNGNLANAPEIVRGMIALVAIANCSSFAGAASDRRDLEAGRLVRVLEAVPRVVRGIYVVYAPSPAKVRLFVDALRDSFRASAGAPS